MFYIISEKELNLIRNNFYYLFVFVDIFHCGIEYKGVVRLKLKVLCVKQFKVSLIKVK